MPYNSCEITDEVEQFRYRLYYFTYYIFNPPYFMVGMIGNILLLYAFYKQSKTEKAYVYQMLSTIGKVFEILTMTMYMLSFKWWSGAESEGVEWFKTNYVLMWFAAYLAIPLANCLITTSLYLSLCMAADRVFAMLRPFVYKNLNHGLHQGVAVVVSCFIGFSTTIFDIWRFYPLSDGRGGYTIKDDQVYLARAAPMALAQLRTVLRVGGLLCLIGLNVTMVVIFRKRSRKIGQMSNSDQKERNRKDVEKMLLLLTILQSSFISIANLPLIIFYALAYLMPTFTSCWGLIVAPFPDLALQVPDAIDFFVVIAINKKTRNMVFKALPKNLQKTLTKTTVKTINTIPEMQHGNVSSVAVPSVPA